MSSLSDLSENFYQYVEHGTVPEKITEESHKNCFYKSVHYIDSVVGPVKDAVFGVEGSSYYLGSRKHGNIGIISIAVFALTYIVL